jgi:transcriptional regulator with XRE-family HTH domain
VKIESGENPNPTIETLERIARALDISIEKLFKE